MGLYLGLGHLAISCALAPCVMSVSTDFRDILLLLYPWSFCALGLGARYMPQDFADRRFQPGALLLPLFSALTLVFILIQSVGLALLVLTLIAWFFCIGGRLASALRLADGRPGSIWACHVAGLAVGYGLSIPLVEAVGPLILLTALGIAWHSRGLLPPVIVACICALSFVQDLEHAVEGYRIGPNADVADIWSDEGKDFGQKVKSLQARANARLQSPSYSGFDWTDSQPAWIDWSRFGLFWLVEAAAPGIRGGMYNFWPQWRMFETAPSESDVSRAAIYRELEPTDRVLIAGIGGGAGLWRLPDVEEIIAIERNPSAVKLINEHPVWSGSVFDNVKLMTMDGRTAFDLAGEGRFDAVIIESARHNPPETMRRMGAMHLMYTAEACESVLRALKPDGFALMFFHDVAAMKNQVFAETLEDGGGKGGNRKAMAGVPNQNPTMKSSNRSIYLTWQLVNAFESLGAETLSFGFPSVAGSREKHMVYVLASKQPGLLQERFGHIAARDAGWLRHTRGDAIGPALTDDFPFASWAAASRRTKRQASRFVGGSILVALAVIGTLVYRRRKRGGSVRAVAFFFLLGVGYILIESATIYRCRALLQDEVRTLLVALPMLLAWATLGSLNARRLNTWSRGALIGLIGAGLCAHVLLLDFLPFRVPEESIRHLGLALALMPGGLLLGVLMPLGLHRHDDPGDALLLDCVGTLLGALIMLPLCLYSSITGALWVGVLMLVAAACVLPASSAGR